MRPGRASALGTGQFWFANPCAMHMVPKPKATMKMRTLALLLSTVALVCGCTPTDHQKLKDELLAADKAFSEASRKDGIQPAFLRVVANDAKLLSDLHPGPDGVRSTYMQFPPTAILTWEPAFVEVSESGDLGYTWGRYTLSLPNVTKTRTPVVHMGTYVTIWRHQPDGSWKVVLDGGEADREK